jgi:hypothetical protein
MNWSKQTLALVVSGSLVLGTAGSGWADQYEQPMVPPAAGTTLPSPAALDQLVAPIALYPDSLVAQILAASTWPAQVVEADRWMQQNSSLKGPEFAQGVDQQAWDPSVKGLTQFPLVLANMDRNLAWSSALGNAYASQPQMVLDAIQVMRWRAREAGHLNGNSNEIVTIEGNTISIYPAGAQTVYLPEYDPWLAYGSPVATWPDWDAAPGLYTGDPDVWFGPAIGLGGFAAFGWGWHHWGADWHRHGVVFNQEPYRSHGEGFDHGERFGGGPAVHEPHLAFAPNVGVPGGLWHGGFGAGNRGFNGVYRGGMTGAFGASRGPGLAGGFRPGGFQGGGFHSGGGFHGGGFGGGGHR